MTKGKKMSKWRNVKQTDSSDDSSVDKIKEVQMEIDKSKEQVQLAIEKAIDRGEELENLEDKAEDLRDDAFLFNKSARQVRRNMCLKNCRATVLCAVVAIALLAILYIFFIHPLIVNDEE